jgi:hypothetical protein
MTLAPEKKSSFPVKPQAQIQQFLTKEDWILRGFIVLSTLWLLVGVLLPLYPM